MNEIERQLARKLLEELLEQKDPAIYKDLARAAHIIAANMMMNWMKQRGYRHCHNCPSTDSLKRINNNFYCPEHAKEVPGIEVLNGVNGHAK